jgi:hypothetical protein
MKSVWGTLGPIHEIPVKCTISDTPPKYLNREFDADWRVPGNSVTYRDIGPVQESQTKSTRGQLYPISKGYAKCRTVSTMTVIS